MMSFHQWSKHKLVHGAWHDRTDHWSKLRCNSYRLPRFPGQCAYCRPQAIGFISSSLHEYSKNSLQSSVLSVHSQNSGPTQSASEEKKAPSSYSQRAKLGFKYWLDDPNQNSPSPGKNVTLGAQGSFHGIGIPRL